MKTTCLIRNILLVGSISLTLASCGGGGGGGGGESSSSGSTNNSGTNNNTQEEILAPKSLTTGMNIEIKYSSGGSDVWSIVSGTSCTCGSQTCTYTYSRTASKVGELNIEYTSGTREKIQLTFTGKNSGTYVRWTDGTETARGNFVCSNNNSGSSSSGSGSSSSGSGSSSSGSGSSSSGSGSSSSGSGSSSSGSGSSSSGSGSTDDADDENIAPYNLAGVVFRKSYGNEFYSFNTGGMTYSFGSSVDQRYTGGGYSYQRTGPTTGTLRFSNASYRGGYLPYFEYTTTYSSNGTVNLTFSKSSGGKLTVSMSGSATTTTKTTDRTSIPYKTKTKTNSSTISGTFNVEL